MIVLALWSVGAAALAVDGASQFGGAEEDRTFRGEVPATLPRNPVICGWEEGSRPRLTIVATGEVVPLTRRVSAGCQGAKHLLPPGVVVEVAGRFAVVGPSVDDTPPLVVGRAVRLSGGHPGEDVGWWEVGSGRGFRVFDIYVAACVWDESPLWATAFPYEGNPRRDEWRLQAGSGTMMVVSQRFYHEGAEPMAFLIRDAGGNVTSLRVSYRGYLPEGQWAAAAQKCAQGKPVRGTKGEQGWW